MKRISYILTILTLLVITVTGCGKHVPDSDAWIKDIDLPVPILFAGGAATKAELESLDDLELGIFGLEHGAPDQINWKNGPNILLNNVKGEKVGDGIQLVGGPYYYPMDNHRNFSFYGYYPTKYANGNDISVIRDKDESLVLDMHIKDNVDILWAHSLAEEAQGSDYAFYEGFNGRYMRKVVAKDPKYLPSLEFKHLTTNIVINAKAQANLSDDDFGKFSDMGFQITGVRINPITYKDVSGVVQEVKIPRYAKLYLAVEDSEKDGDGIKGTSPAGHKPGELVPIVNEGDGGYIDYKLETPVSFSAKDEPYMIGQFFLVPFDVLSGYKMNLTISYSMTINEVQKSESLDIQIDLKDVLRFEAGKRYMYNIVFYPLEETKINITGDGLSDWTSGNGDEGQDIDFG